MKIELQNVLYNEQMSQETYFFSALLCIDGYNAVSASNYGHGGATNFIALDNKGLELFKSAEEWCKRQLPMKTQGHELPMDLELYTNNLLEAYITQRNKGVQITEKTVFSR